MTEGSIVAIVVAVIGLLGTGIAFRPRNPRDVIKADLELADLLPEGEIQAALRTHAEGLAKQLVQDEQNSRRNGFGIIIGSVFLAGGLYLFAFSLPRGGYYPWFGGFYALLGLILVSLSARKRPRERRLMLW